jgi:hypothetical protein
MTRLGLVLQIGFLRMSGRHLHALERVPSSVRAYAAAQIGVAAPQLATLRTIYRRRPTLFEHQRLAELATGFNIAGEAQLRMLTAYLRRQVVTEYVRERLVLAARRWLYDRSFLISGDRSLETMAVRAQDHVLGQLKAAIEAGVGSEIAAGWAAKLSGNGPNAGEALLDWLRAPARGFGTRALRDMQKRIDELRNLGAERIVLPEVPIERMRQHAVRIAPPQGIDAPAAWRAAAHGRDRLLAAAPAA